MDNFTIHYSSDDFAAAISAAGKAVTPYNLKKLEKKVNSSFLEQVKATINTMLIDLALQEVE